MSESKASRPGRRSACLPRWAAGAACSCCDTAAARIRERGERRAQSLAGVAAQVVEGSSVIGGGSTPEQALPTWLVAIECGHVTALERRLRAGDPPVVARIEDGRLLLDLRTVFEDEDVELAQAVLAAIKTRSAG